MRKNEHKFIKIGTSLLAIIAIAGAIPVSSNNVEARQKVHVHHAIKKNINQKKHVTLSNGNKINEQNANKNMNHKKSTKKHKKHPRIIMASSIFQLKKQVKDVNNAISKDKKKKLTSKVAILSKEKTDLEQEIQRIDKNDKYLAHSPRAKQNYQWLTQNGLQSYDKLNHKNKMFHKGFLDGASLKGTDTAITNKYTKNKAYEKGWLVGYASKITSSKTYPQEKAYHKAFLVYNHGSMYARHNNLDRAYLEIANVWGQYDV